jgi:hypothetical protein
LENKHKIKVKRKRWRKLHLGLDLVSGEIICSELTTDDVGDPTALSDLLSQITVPVERFFANGAYDGAPTRDLLATRLGDTVEVIIPPRKMAVQSSQSAENLPPYLTSIDVCRRGSIASRRFSIAIRRLIARGVPAIAVEGVWPSRRP